MRGLIKIPAIFLLLMIGACQASFSLAPYSSFKGDVKNLKNLWMTCAECLGGPQCKNETVKGCREITLPSRDEALSRAVGRANMEAVVYLVDIAKADVNGVIGRYQETPLRIASYYGSGTHGEVLKFLLKRGANVNSVGSSEYRTPLLTAIWKNNIPTAKLLLEHGADPSITTLNGTDACTFAIFRSEVELVPLMKNCCSVALESSYAAQEVIDACRS